MLLQLANCTLAILLDRYGTCDCSTTLLSVTKVPRRIRLSKKKKRTILALKKKKFSARAVGKDISRTANVVLNFLECSDRCGQKREAVGRRKFHFKRKCAYSEKRQNDAKALAVLEMIFVWMLVCVAYSRCCQAVIQCSTKKWNLPPP